MSVYFEVLAIGIKHTYIDYESMYRFYIGFIVHVMITINI